MTCTGALSAMRQGGSHFAQHPRQGTLQLSDAGFAGVLARNEAQRVVIDDNVGRRPARLLQLAWQQVVARDGDFLVLV